MEHRSEQQRRMNTNYRQHKPQSSWTSKFSKRQPAQYPLHLGAQSCPYQATSRSGQCQDGCVHTLRYQYSEDSLNSPETIQNPSYRVPSYYYRQQGGRRLSPMLTHARGQGIEHKQNRLPRDRQTSSPPNYATTMEKTTATIGQSLSPPLVQPLRPSATKIFTSPSSLRMPFEEGPRSPPSPSSMYTDVTMSQRYRDSGPISPEQGYDTRASIPSTIAEQEVSTENPGIGLKLLAPIASHPAPTTEQFGMHARMPPSTQPLKLDIGAVREMQKRGSITSLPDLIKRATKLASNLDRGQTASRLGHVHGRGDGDKLVHSHVRESTYSDVLAAFPPAGAGTPNTMWPMGEKKFMTSKFSLSQTTLSRHGTQRRCCGLPPLIVVLILIGVVLLVVAAVLIPIFVVALPRLHEKNSLSHCPSSHACLNGGVSVLMNNACSCVCVDGFTGNDCSTERDSDCTIDTLIDGTRTYENATIGKSVLPIFNAAQISFNIALNSTNLLSIFASNNLSCASENVLVNFSSGATTASKRFVTVADMMGTGQHSSELNPQAPESKDRRRFVIVNGVGEAAGISNLRPTSTIQRRDGATSTNGIVYATTTSVHSTPVSSQSSGPNTSSGISTSTSSAAAATQTATTQNTQQQFDFAATVVLYVSQTFQQINVAVAANQAMASYFKETKHVNNTVMVVSGTQRITADFDKLRIVLANGTIVGGT